MFDHMTCVYVREIYEKFGSSRWSCSWLGQKVNIAVVVALTGGDFGSWRIRPNKHVVSAW